MRCVSIRLQAGIEGLNSPFLRMKGHKKIRNNEIFEPSQDELHGIWNGEIIQKKLKELGITRTVGESVELVTKPLSQDEDAAYEPPLKRKWLPGPLSRLSTAHSRRDWFRLMTHNMMVDNWTHHPLDETSRALLDMRDPKLTHFRTTPVSEVRPHIPKFARDGALETDPEFVPFDPALDGTDPPPFLSNSFRALHLHNEVKFYKPDILCLNEVQREFAHSYLWRSLRPLGYGMYFNSSRGHSVHGATRGALLTRRTKRVPLAEDIGNCVFYHKGRFCPFFRGDLPQLHTVSVMSMRDKVTQMQIMLACVQLTAGSDAEAIEQRKHEASQILRLIDLLWTNDVDRFHATTVICGDLNNVTDDEPCVEIFRSRLFSCYDIAGGPRWTAWYHEGSSEMNKYADKALSMREHELYTASGLTRPSEIRQFIKPPIPGTRPTNVFQPEEPKQQRNLTKVLERKPLTQEELSELSKQIPDKLQLRNEIQKRQGVVQRTQDFVFHNPELLALVQLLDTPSEEQIDPIQLMPCRINPSHHIPLVVDLAFNNQNPVAGELIPRTLQAP